MKIKIVYPKIEEAVSFKLAGKILGIRRSALPLALPTLAALTPQEFKLEIIDENVNPIRFSQDVDLVAISFNTHNAKRAYEIAEAFKARRVMVVMGGIHASMIPEEALHHCDAVVVGEAENLWALVLNDFKQSKLKKIYRTEEPVDLSAVPAPRWDLIDAKNYFYIPIQSSRGCPHDCDFCLDSKYYGRKVRLKTIEQVIKEIDFIRLHGKSRPVLFGDYIFLSDPLYVKKLTEYLEAVQMKNWMAFGHIGIGHQHEILDLLARGGCSLLNVGIESISQDSLDELGRKTYKAKELKELIKNIRSHGIDVYAGFMFGSDADKLPIFDETVEFIEENNLLFPQINILQPYPGTKLFDKLKAEGRLLYGSQWEKYVRHEVSFEPKLMSAQQLKDGYNRTIKTLFSYDSIYRRLSELLKQGFYTQENFEKQMQNFFIRKISPYVPQVLRYLLRGDDLKKFLTKCAQNAHRPSLHAILVAVGYHDSYVSQLGKNLWTDEFLQKEIPRGPS